MNQNKRDHREISNLGFRLTRHAMMKWVDDAAIFVHTETGRMHALNPTASYIWKLALEGSSLSEIEQCITTEFDIDQAGLSGEIDTLFSSLIEEGLIERTENIVIQINRSGAFVNGTPSELARIRTEFDQRCYLRLPCIVTSELFDQLLGDIEHKKWVERKHGKIGVESCMDDEQLRVLISFLFNDQSLFRFLETVTGCTHIGSFEGRVYRFEPGAGHYDSWHDDSGGHRLLAFSLNLSRNPYEGGILQIRNRNTQTMISEVANPVPGDAVVFRLANDLEHRVTPVVGKFPRTAFAGWFKSQPDIWSMITSKFGAEDPKASEPSR